MFDIPPIGTEQGVERTLRDMMEDKGYGHLNVSHGPDDEAPDSRGRLRRWMRRLLGRETA